VLQKSNMYSRYDSTRTEYQHLQAKEKVVKAGGGTFGDSLGQANNEETVHEPSPLMGSQGDHVSTKSLFT
jgi:hypothetical protein